MEYKIILFNKYPLIPKLLDKIEFESYKIKNLLIKHSTVDLNDQIQEIRVN